MQRLSELSNIYVIHSTNIDFYVVSRYIFYNKHNTKFLPVYIIGKKINLYILFNAFMALHFIMIFCFLIIVNIKFFTCKVKFKLYFVSGIHIYH